MKARVRRADDPIAQLPNTGSQPAVVADFRFHLAACGALCEANSGAWLRQPDREVALAAALAIKQPQVELEHAQPGHAWTGHDHAVAR